MGPKQILTGVADSLLELTVAPSFSRVGYLARRRMFDWQPLPGAAGKVVVVTGATSGLGRAAATELSAHGALVTIVGRDQRRTEVSADQIAESTGNKVATVIADMSDLTGVKAAAEQIATYPRLDALIHNAGALLNEYTQAVGGHEMTFSAHVLGPHLMTNTLLPLLAATDGSRVITVTSGGMYAEKLNMDAVEMGREGYDGVRAYARAKRAQVVLNQQWAIRHGQESLFHATHPGWADTPGVVESLPGFHKVMGPFLRNPQQGADTMEWLATSPEPLRSNGLLWLDRAPRPTSKLPWTRTSDADAAALWELVDSLALG